MCCRRRGTCPTCTPNPDCNRCSASMSHPHLPSSPRCSRPRARTQRSSNKECAATVLTFQVSKSVFAVAGNWHHEGITGGVTCDRRPCPAAQAYQQALCQRNSPEKPRISATILLAARLLLHFKCKARKPLAHEVQHIAPRRILANPCLRPMPPAGPWRSFPRAGRRTGGRCLDLHCFLAAVDPPG